MAEITVTVRDNGPYLIRGPITVSDAAGTTFEPREAIALCRCGASNTKPFCDGSHNTNGFESAPRAATPEA